MREIKFRGKSLDGKWLFGYIYRYVNRDGIDTVAIIEIENNGFDATLNLHKISHNTVGQCTGLHDKNGKEIYEGDIIRSFDSKGEPIIHYLLYDNEESGFVAILKGSTKGDFGYGRSYQQWITECEKEVIGNVHDNPELLKGN